MTECEFVDRTREIVASYANRAYGELIETMGLPALTPDDVDIVQLSKAAGNYRAEAETKAPDGYLYIATYGGKEIHLNIFRRLYHMVYSEECEGNRGYGNQGI